MRFFTASGTLQVFAGVCFAAAPALERRCSAAASSWAWRTLLCSRGTVYDADSRTCFAAASLCSAHCGAKCTLRLLINRTCSRLGMIALAPVPDSKFSGFGTCSLRLFSFVHMRLALHGAPPRNMKFLTVLKRPSNRAMQNSEAIPKRNRHVQKTIQIWI